MDNDIIKDKIRINCVKHCALNHSNSFFRFPPNKPKF